MKILLKLVSVFILLLVLFLVAALFTSFYVTPSSAIKVDNSSKLLIDNVNLITMVTEEVSYNKQVLIEQGKIVSINEARKPPPEGYLLIDGKQGFLLPGLIDTHVHAMDPANLKLSLSFGVTTVRNMGGYPMHLAWREQLNKGVWLGSSLLTSSAIINGCTNADIIFHKVIDTPLEARAHIKRTKADGYDLVKVYEGLNIDTYAAILDEADRLGIPVAGHPPALLDDENLYLMGHLSSIEHAEEIFDSLLNSKEDEEKLIEIAQKLNKLNVPVTSTLMVSNHLVQLIEQRETFIGSLPLHFINPLVRFFAKHTAVNRWLNVGTAERHYNLKLNNYLPHIINTLNKNGVDIALGTDAGALYTSFGYAVHEEISLLKKSGLSEYQVLKTATVNAADVIGRSNQFGTIEVGKTADLILVNKNPLVDLTILETPDAVIKNGQWLDKGSLKILRTESADLSGVFITIGRVLEYLFSK